MLLTITTTHQPATDLGFLLEKHPEKVHEFTLSGGRATVFYTEATESRCSVALLLDIDPIGLVRGKGPAMQGMDQYVNDRPYVASSFLSVALGVAFRSALAGKSRHRPELAMTPIPIEVFIPVLPCRGGERFLRELFEPLGYTVHTQSIPLDSQFIDWGNSPYVSVTLAGCVTLKDVLRHLYVLIPVLDDKKHYWVGEAEVEKLLRHAGEWLPVHPLRERIATRYLKHRRSLARQALEQLVVEEEEGVDDDLTNVSESQAREQKIEARVSLNQQRMTAVASTLRSLGAKSVVDLGCGEGRLLSVLLQDRKLERIVGVDVSIRTLELASDRLRLDRMPPLQRQRIELLQGSLTYRDARLKGFDVATVIEVIEHLDLARLNAFERVLFGFCRAQAVVITTPNREYNVKFENLPAGQFRHGDHRFEWTRAEFHEWCERQTVRFGYLVRYESVGETDSELGPPTQMAIFELSTTNDGRLTEGESA